MEKASRSHPHYLTHPAPTPGSYHSGKPQPLLCWLWQWPCPTALKAEARTSGFQFHPWANTWLLNDPLPCVDLVTEFGTEDFKSYVMEEGHRTPGLLNQTSSNAFRGQYYQLQGRFPQTATKRPCVPTWMGLGGECKESTHPGVGDWLSGRVSA